MIIDARLRQPLAWLASLVFVAGCAQDAPEQQPVSDDPLVRTTVEGTVRGQVGNNGALEWLGIPFAEPPTDELRWMPPLPPAERDSIRASFEAPDCAQLGNPFSPDYDGLSVVGSEDCLYLDIYAPAESNGGESLPVMVWIHGGANTWGGPGNMSGNRLVPDQNVVLVAVRYRLGPFGWMSHPALRTGANAAASFAMLDLIRSLEWLNENIASFGGDAGNVTIMGHSAGGRNVLGLMLAPQANGLFHKAIIQSGGMHTHSQAEAENLGDAEIPGHRNSSREMFLRLLQLKEVAADRESALKADAGLPLDAKRAMWLSATPEELLASTEKRGRFLRVPDLIRDGVVIPFSGARETFEASEHNAVPTIMGTTHGETKLYLLANPDLVTFEGAFRPSVKDEEYFERIAYYGSAGWKVAAVDEPLSLLSNKQEPPVFAYRFDYDDLPSPFGINLPLIMGATHGLDVSFVLGQFHDREFPNYYYDDSNKESRELLSNAMMAYWAEFARNGDPGDGGSAALPLWHAWTEMAILENLMIFDAGGEQHPRMTSLRIDQDMLLTELEQDTEVRSRRHKCEAIKAINSFRAWGESQLDEAQVKYCD